MGAGTPAGALADQLDLALALPRHHALDHGGERLDPGAGDLAQRRPLVAEDAGVAVLVGADRVADPEVREHPRENPHRMLDSRVLGVGLDALEGRLGAHPLDLELGDEHDRLAGGALGEHDRPLGREEAEAREVLDVVLVEEDVAAEPVAAHVLEEPAAPLCQLARRDAGAWSRRRLQLGPPLAVGATRAPGPGTRAGTLALGRPRAHARSAAERYRIRLSKRPRCSAAPVNDGSDSRGR